MNAAAVVSFVLGVVTGFACFAVLLPVVTRRVRANHAADLAELDAEMQELRRDQAEDREINRRLRRELAVNTPDDLATTREQRDIALDELEQLQAELRRTTQALAVRDRSLREARLAIHEIRLQLERGRFPSASDTPGQTSADDPLIATVRLHGRAAPPALPQPAEIEPAEIEPAPDATTGGEQPADVASERREESAVAGPTTS